MVRVAFDIAKKTELEEIKELEEVLESGNQKEKQEEVSVFEGMRFLAAEDNELNAEILVEILKMRMNAKHKKLSQEFLDSYHVTNKDVKDGLKLIINSYT